MSRKCPEILDATACLMCRDVGWWPRGGLGHQPNGNTTHVSMSCVGYGPTVYCTPWSFCPACPCRQSVWIELIMTDDAEPWPKRPASVSYPRHYRTLAALARRRDGEVKYLGFWPRQLPQMTHRDVGEYQRCGPAGLQGQMSALHIGRGAG